jgi:hypothetical protein
MFDRVPLAAVERSDTINFYLAPTSLGIKVQSTCSTSVIVNWEQKVEGEAELEFVGLPIPETYVSTIKNGDLVTAPLDTRE